MKLAGLALLALGASSAAYVVTDKPMSEGAVEARHPGSGPALASHIVATLSTRHHRGKGKKNTREAEPIVEPESIIATLNTRHHTGKSGKNKKNAREAEAEPQPHHAGKGKTGKNRKNTREAEAEADPEPHHRGKGKKAGN